MLITKSKLSEFFKGLKEQFATKKEVEDKINGIEGIKNSIIKVGTNFDTATEKEILFKIKE